MKMKRKHRNWLLMGVVIMFILAIRAFSSYQLPPAKYYSGALPYAIAHQGGAGLRPGNTLIAFENAMALGVDVLELDVHATREGELVVIHDASVDRTTDGSGLVLEKSLVELKALDAAYNWPFERSQDRPYRSTGVTIPRLSEVFDAFPGTRYVIEIKQDQPSIVESLCEMLVNRRLLGATIVGSTHADAMLEFREKCPMVATSSFSSEIAWFLLYHNIGLVRLYQPTSQAFQVPTHIGSYDFLDEGFVYNAGRRGIHVEAWTINDTDTMRKLLDEGVSGIITDYPDELLKLMNRNTEVQ